MANTALEAYYRADRPGNGLTMPFFLEIKVQKVAQTEKIEIDKGCR